jgi:hypothetical protein
MNESEAYGILCHVIENILTPSQRAVEIDVFKVEDGFTAENILRWLRDKLLTDEQLDTQIPLNGKTMRGFPWH